MGKKISGICVFALISILPALLFPAFAGDDKLHPLKALKKKNGQKWRIGYLEGGPYNNYQANLKAFITALAERGWIRNAEFPQTEDDDETQTLWKWLAEKEQSDYLDFVADAYWSGDWDREKRKRNKKEVIERLNGAKDIDLMLAFGTWAGLDLANDLHAVPTMLFSTSDPIRAGIVRSMDDSGYDHLHARVDPKRHERQIRLFHEVAGFKKLGIAFQDSPEGRSYAALDDAYRIAGEKGFEILECSYRRQKAYSEEEKNRLLACHEQLAEKCDAFYLTVQTGVNPENLPALLHPFFRHNIPTFSQGRTFEVRNGVLMSLVQENFQALGRFHANILSRILHGENPRDLPQLFEGKQEIAINLETAKKIGFDFPIEVLAAAKEIYEHTGASPLAPAIPASR